MRDEQTLFYVAWPFIALAVCFLAWIVLRRQGQFVRFSPVMISFGALWLLLVFFDVIVLAQSSSIRVFLRNLSFLHPQAYLILIAFAVYVTAYYSRSDRLMKVCLASLVVLQVIGAAWALFTRGLMLFT